MLIRNKHVLAVIVVVCCPLLTSSAQGQPAQKKKDIVRKMSPSSMYTTIFQKDMKRMSRKYRTGPDGRKVYLENYGYQLEKLYDFHNGASNIFLVRGANLGKAVRATVNVYLGAAHVEEPPDAADGFKHWNYWLVVNFGSNSGDPPVYKVLGAEQNGTTIRLTYVKPKRFGGSTDCQPYLVWIPLGKLKAGKYKLELYNYNQTAKDPRNNNLVKLVLLVLTEYGLSAVCMMQLLSKGLGQSS